MTWALVAVVVLLAYANGANDNFKGVATLFGSGTTDYRRALVLATISTLGGSLLAVTVARSLVTTFSGKGLVPDAIVTSPAFLMAVAGGAALTVLLAARIGMPISTTHSLIGALAGVGLVASGADFAAGRLWKVFLLPLIVSPGLALVGAAVLYPLFRRARRRLAVTRTTCLCVGETIEAVVPVAGNRLAVARTGMVLTVDQRRLCEERYTGNVAGVDAQWALDRLHYVSAGAVSFARGLNDAPKIVALLLAAQAFPTAPGVLLVGLAMALGGWLAAGRVAETMSHGITRMNHGQGFTANLITSVLVIGASRFGVPVSTTHVSGGALFGIGAVTGGAHWSMIGTIVMAWITTLPVAGAVGAILYLLLR